MTLVLHGTSAVSDGSVLYPILVQGYDLLDTDGGGADGEADDSEEEDIFGRKGMHSAEDRARRHCASPILCLNLQRIRKLPPDTAREKGKKAEHGSSDATWAFPLELGALHGVAIRVALRCQAFLWAPHFGGQAFQDGDYDKAIRYWQGQFVVECSGRMSVWCVRNWIVHAHNDTYWQLLASSQEHREAGSSPFWDRFAWS